jgi:hypothetical protein
MKLKVVNSTILKLVLCSILFGCAEDPDAIDEGFLSEEYPGDVGMESDPGVIWMENFEENSIGEILSRYEDYKNPDGMYLDNNTPAFSSGSQSLALIAGGDQEDATDFYKNFGEDGYEQWYIRWYVKYQPDAEYHHTGVWFGGYWEPLNWPYPRAGTKPDGDDLFSIAVESNPQGVLDFYNYWMRMHSWSDPPSSYWGNSLVHHSGCYYDDEWICIEVYSKINPSLNSGDGAELTLWINDELIVDFTDTTGLGHWVADKFCTRESDLPSCTNYPPDEGEEMIPLDLQVRIIEELKLNYLWPQNYTTSEGQTTVWFDDIVIATRRIGSLR